MGANVCNGAYLSQCCLDLDNVGNSNESHDAEEKKKELEVVTPHKTADDEAVESSPATGNISCFHHCKYM